MQVELFKKISKYKNKDGEDKTAINFYVKVGDEFVPIEVRYFEDKKNDGNDPNYRGRKLLLTAMAEILPEKQKTTANKNEVPAISSEDRSEQVVMVEQSNEEVDDDLPF